MPSTVETSEKMQADDENIGLGCALENFAEVDEVLCMIDQLKDVYNAELSVIERAYERYVYILDQYHEQPHLLDSNIEKLLEKLCNIVRNTENPVELMNLAFKYMYIIIKVRGYKIVVRHLPHEVSDFEPILKCLENQDPVCSETWTTRYVLLLWLSIIVKIPFHMSRLDDIECTETKTVITRMFDICKIYVVAADKCRDAAAYLASQFLTRVDIKNEYLPLFFDWACDIASNKASTVFAIQGALASIAMILKYGKREDLLPHATRLLRFIINTEYKDTPGTQIPKLGFKIIQRIGLVYLKSRVVSWRYQRGSRTLTTNLSAGDGIKDSTTSTEDDLELEGEDDDDNIEVPEEIEDVIDELMQGLKSIDGVVRWSAAKGIGRVTSRLPKDLADEVVGSVLELFTPREGDGAWHGGCLTLAELGRRGLLLPQRLPEVVPVVVKALMYDEPRGYASVGAHVRDAACYVSWAFARAYDIEVLRPFVTEIAQALLIVTVFDREINCRRAASAAFQENVGRQGAFPYGIEILTVADFFAVGARQNTYLNVSVYIAQFEEYTTSLIDHLVEKKVSHWDTAIREITSKALHNLTEKAPDYMASSILDKLFVMSTSIDLNARHGSLLAICEILLALSKIAAEKLIDLSSFVTEDILQKVRNLIPTYRERLYFRGLGGELMKQACSFFIQKCSQAHLPFHSTSVIDDWINLLNECLSYEVPSVRMAAIDALCDFFTEYYQSTDKINDQTTIVNLYITNLKTNNKVVQMGHLLALGSLPSFMLKDHLDNIIDAIIKTTVITEITLKWAESRRDALKALTMIHNTMGTTEYIGLLNNITPKLYECFFNGLGEYTQDNRGDIGAWVREAAMTGIQALTLLLCQLNSSILDEHIVTKIIAGLAQQAVEKIDRTRALAGKIFSSLIHSDPEVPHIQHHDELREIFPASDCELTNWNSETITFPKFVCLLPFPEYTYNMLLGLIVSIGGLTETLVKSSSSALFAFLNAYKGDEAKIEIKRISEVILDIFVKYQKIDRITVPMFRFLEKLLASGCLQCIIDDPNSNFAARTVKMIQLEISGCKDIYKLIDGINVLCQFVQIQQVCSTALVQLSILLCHRHTYVRKSTSARLYEALLVYGENSSIPPENLDEVMALLSETDWENSVDVVRPFRNTMCELMDVRVPVLKPKK